MHFAASIVKPIWAQAELTQTPESRSHQLVTVVILVNEIIDLFRWETVLGKSHKANISKIKPFHHSKDKSPLY